MTIQTPRPWIPRHTRAQAMCGMAARAVLFALLCAGSAAAPLSAFQAEGAVVRIVDGNGQVGSGFVFWISPEQGNTAYVLTAFHVVRDFDLGNRFDVTFSTSDLRATGSVTGQPYPELDLAVLKLSRYPTGLRPLQFGAAGSLAVGAPLYVLGYPGGGALRRDDGTLSGRSAGRLYLDDVNPDFGNSGGPVMDADGDRVVGMIIQKSTGRSAQYAINGDVIRATVEDDFVFADLAPEGPALVRLDPSLVGSVHLRREPAVLSEDDARDAVVEHGLFSRDVNPVGSGVENQFQESSIRRGSLSGLNLRTLSRDELQRTGAGRASGVLVTRVAENSEGAYAGFQQGDIVWSFDGAVPADASDLVALIYHATPGATVDVELTRGGRLQSLRVRVAEGADRVVIDHTTSLMWQKQAADDPELDFKDHAFAVTWINHLNAIAFAGHSDWRLPTLEELMSLVEPRQVRPGTYDALYLDPIFTGGRGEDIWTSDTWAGVPDRYYWTVNFRQAVYRYAANLAYVRAVRSVGR